MRNACSSRTGVFVLDMSDKLNKTDTRLERINDLVDGVLSGSGLYRVETRIKGSSHQPMVDVFIDGDDGVNIDQCASVSRSLFASIELESIFKNGFKLDVSSPGLGQPLRLPRQYKRHVGRTLEVLIVSGESADRTLVSGQTGSDGTLRHHDCRRGRMPGISIRRDRTGRSNPSF